jgi:hypothetical protein
MRAIVIARVKEIRRLHEEIISALRLTLPKAIRIGELLAEQKAAMPHGDFFPWVAEHCEFSERTAERYMILYRRRDLLKSDSVTGLAGAYRLLESPKAQPWEGLDICEWYHLAVAELRFVIAQLDAIFDRTPGQDDRKLALLTDLRETALSLAQIGAEMVLMAGDAG